MKRARYSDNTNATVGFLNTDGAEYLEAANSYTTAAFAADTVVRVTPTAGGVWIDIDPNPSVTADSDGAHYIDAAQDFAVSTNDKIKSTGLCNVTPFE